MCEATLVGTRQGLRTRSGAWGVCGRRRLACTAPRPARLVTTPGVVRCSVTHLRPHPRQRPFSIPAAVRGREGGREVQALTFANGGSQSIHEPPEGLAGGRGDVQGAASQQVDLARVLPELIQVPGQQAELLTLRAAFLLQLPHPALRGGDPDPRSAGGLGCWGPACLSARMCVCECVCTRVHRTACHVCMGVHRTACHVCMCE